MFYFEDESYIYSIDIFTKASFNQDKKQGIFEVL
jgi:hypothetical protein